MLAPTGRDGPLIADVLARAGLAAEVCPGAADLCRRCDEGAGALVVAEEALSASSLACLDEMLARQPAWSDLPLLVLTGGGKTTRYSTRVAGAFKARGNVTLLERPLRMLTLTSAVRSALRARRRQYEVCRLLDEARLGVRQRDQFLAMLGHELRNPVAAIRAAAEVLNQDGAAGRTAPRGGRRRRPGPAPRAAQIIARQSVNVSRLVDDLLDVARVTSGKVALHRRAVDLREVARRAMQAQRRASGATRHDITFDDWPEPLVVDGDEVRLEQVVVNLLTNAIKYTPPGGAVRVAVAREGGQAGGGGEAVIRVRDTGHGIDADLLPHVFEPFVQAERSLARSVGGLGIGLTVVRTLVRMHGGTIAAASEGPGRGSEFTVRLPLAARAPGDGPGGHADGPPCGSAAAPEGGKAAAARRRGAGAAASRRVVLVEDNADARRAMERLLKLWGHHVEVAADGASGVERAVASEPDVMLVDIGLPDIDGYEVARGPARPSAEGSTWSPSPATGSPRTASRARAAGFDRHLVKPVEPDHLEQVLADDGGGGGA